MLEAKRNKILVGLMVVLALSANMTASADPGFLGPFWNWIVNRPTNSDNPAALGGSNDQDFKCKKLNASQSATFDQGFKIPLNPGLAKALRSDANGNAAWEYLDLTVMGVHSLSEIEINRKQGLSARNLINGWVDTFTDSTGISGGETTSATVDLTTCTLFPISGQNMTVFSKDGIITSAQPTVTRIVISMKYDADIIPGQDWKISCNTDATYTWQEITPLVSNRGGGGTVDPATLTIQMTTENTNIATASSIVSLGNSDYQAWRAFDRLHASPAATAWVSAVTGTPWWIQYKFPDGIAKNVTRYVIRSRNYSSGVDNPRSWIFRGSNDGTSWEDIQPITNGFTTNTLSTDLGKTFDIPGNEKKFLYHRLHIISTVASLGSVTIGEIYLYTAYQKIIYNGEISLTGASTIRRWKLTTHNEKSPVFYGIGMTWE